MDEFVYVLEVKEGPPGPQTTGKNAVQNFNRVLDPSLKYLIRSSLSVLTS